MVRPTLVDAGGDRVAPGVSGDLWADVFSGQMRLPPGSYLYQQGDAAETVYLIQDGMMKLVSGDGCGGELIVDFRHAPTILGVTATSTGRPHNTAAVTGTMCTLRVCDARAFRAAVAANGARISAVQLLQGEEIETLTSRIVAMALKDGEQRFLHMIRSFSDPVPASAPRKMALPLKHCEIASYLGITPEHLSRIVSRLSRRGVIEVRNGWIFLTAANSQEAPYLDVRQLRVPHMSTPRPRMVNERASLDQGRVFDGD